MAKILVLGGGFAGVVAAQRLAAELGDEHQLTLVSRSRSFVFYPALVRLAFGKCERDDVLFDLRGSMLSRRINFIEAEVAHIDPHEQRVAIARGEIEGSVPYDYLIFALGRRLATERIPGFYEHAHHLLNVDKAIKFGKAVSAFHEGRAIIGECPDARLPVPVYETALALSHLLEEGGERERVKITIVRPGAVNSQEEDGSLTAALRTAMDADRIELISDFPINQVTPGAVHANNGHSLNFNLLMLVPPFEGSPAVSHLGITENTYINVDWHMKVIGADRMYAAGDCVNFTGPKLGHMAVRQAEVAAANLAAELQGNQPIATYEHEIRLVIDEGGADSIYVHQNVWPNEPASVRQGRFWHWAKRVQERYWTATHM